MMATHGLAYPISIGGAGKYWRKDLLVQKKLFPEITSNTVIAWRTKYSIFTGSPEVYRRDSCL
ncbi:MAG: hypothetical protein V8S01_04155 [Dorea sp.]